VFVIKVRSSPGSLITVDFECPVHGRFEARVPRGEDGDPPATWPCPSLAWTTRRAKAISRSVAERYVGYPCGLVAYWRPGAPAVHTQFVISAHRGPGDAKPHPEAMDTRPLAEGRRNEFRRARKKLREERRHKRVKELLR